MHGIDFVTSSDSTISKATATGIDPGTIYDVLRVYNMVMYMTTSVNVPTSGRDLTMRDSSSTLDSSYQRW
jgi:hypothetical protein